MCNDARQCMYCKKWVRDKRFLGTLHLCLSEEDRRYVDNQDAQARHAMQLQRQFMARQERLGEPFESILHKNLWDLYAR